MKREHKPIVTRVSNRDEEIEILSDTDEIPQQGASMYLNCYNRFFSNLSTIIITNFTATLLMLNPK